MDCFQTETAADLAASHARHMAVHVVNICGNCGETAERLTFVPEFEFEACDICMEDVTRALAAECQPEVIPAGVCPTRYALVCAADTIDEMRLALRAHEAGCPQCGGKPVVSDTRLVNLAAAGLTLPELQAYLSVQGEAA